MHPQPLARTRKRRGKNFFCTGPSAAHERPDLALVRRSHMYPLARSRSNASSAS